MTYAARVWLSFRACRLSTSCQKAYRAITHEVHSIN